MAKKAKNTRQETPAQPQRDVSIPFDRILLYAIAVVLFVIPLFFLPGITEYGYGKTMVALVAISILSILWVLAAWQKGSWRLRIPWIVFPFLAFVVASLLSIITAINGRVVVQTLVLAIFFFQLAFLIANVVRNKRDVVILLGSVLASAFFISLYGLLQYLGVLAGPAGATGLNRIISTLGNRNFLGGFLGYILLPSFVLVLRPRWAVWRVVFMLVIAFNFGTLMLVQQLAPIVGLVSAIIALLVGIVVFRPIEPIRKNRAWLVGLLALLVLTFLIEAPSGPLNSVVGLSQTTTEQANEPGWIGQIWQRNSGRTRELDWWVGVEMLKANPMTGVGLGNYKLGFLPYKAAFLATERGAGYTDLKVARAAQAHGDYVQVAAELGGLGILSLLGFLGVLAVSVWRRLRRNADESDRLDLLLYAAGVIVFLVHALVSFPAHLPVSILSILVLLGLFHAPAYGETCVVSVRLGRRVTLAVLGVVTVVGIVVSAFALSDLRANVLMGRGILELQVGNVAEAKDYLERSLALDFAPRQTYYHLARAQAILGDTEAALENYEKCFTRFVDEAVYLTYADIAVSLGRLEEARGAIEFLLATGPVTAVEVRARYIEAMIAAQLRDFNGATRLLEELAEDAPGFELAWIALGNLYDARNLDALAVEAYRTALDVIDAQLANVAAMVASGGDSAELRATRGTLQNERSFVLEQLANLSSD